MHATQLVATFAPRPGYAVTDEERRTGKARMASGAFRDPRVVVVDVPDPTPGHGEVVVEVRACGVCGSDTHCIETDADGYVLFSGPSAFPCVLGHEYAGRVVAVGPGVRGLREGQLVTAEGMLYCGVCDACRHGWFNQCSRLDMVGFSSPGAFAPYIRVHEKHCYDVTPLADRLGDADEACAIASMVEPIGCSYNGVWVAAGGMAPGAHVVVFGCGPIGLGAIALCRAAGAATVLAVDPVPARRAVALALGADVAWDPSTMSADMLASAIRDHTRGWGADVLIEAAGAADRTMATIEAAMAPQSTMVYLGRTGLRAPVGLDTLVSGACRIVGARGHAGGGVYPAILRMLTHGRLDVAAMITHRMPLDEAPAALERSRTREDGKIVLMAPPAR